MSQKDKVLKQMRTYGYVTRNWALQNFISRLSAIMLDLKKQGINFEPKELNGDYIYTLKDKPKEKIVYRIPQPDGTVIVKEKVIW